MPEHSPQPILALIGPTAVGKTALSLAIAEQTSGEIVSVDSRQIYRGLDIGTAKPIQSDRERIRHHFIDELELDQPFSAGVFASQAEDRIGEVLARGNRPIVVGGSTLYLEALMHGLADVPPTSAETRSRLNKRLEREGAPTLFQELKRLDAPSAATMDPTKTQRIVRALEVYYDTDRPLSSYHAHKTKPAYSYAPMVLTRPRAVLYERINQRVEAMLQSGLVDEVRRVVEAGYSSDLNPLRTIGYREPLAFLRGELSYERMAVELKQNSRRYAKRQLTWFRRRDEYSWIDLEECNSISEVVSMMTVS